MKAREVLSQEYQKHLATTHEGGSEFALLNYLERIGALAPVTDWRFAALAPEQYTLEVCLYTDGDYWCTYPGLSFIECEETYFLRCGWGQLQDAVPNAISILQAVKNCLCGRTSVCSELAKRIDTAIENIQNFEQADVTYGGNYEGTCIRFERNSVEPWTGQQGQGDRT